MSVPRRVIVTADEDGVSTIGSDIATKASFDVGVAAMHQVWLTTATPADTTTDGLDGASGLPLAQPAAGGTLFQVCEFQPGMESPLHKTDTIDYVYVAEGEIEMDTSDGSTVRLSVGDCLVQLATAHRWANRSDKPCSLVVVCISTKTDPGDSLDIEVVG